MSVKDGPVAARSQTAESSVTRAFSAGSKDRVLFVPDNFAARAGVALGEGAIIGKLLGQGLQVCHSTGAKMGLLGARPGLGACCPAATSR